MVLKESSASFTGAEFLRHVNDHGLIKWVENNSLINAQFDRISFLPLPVTAFFLLFLFSPFDYVYFRNLCK